MNRIIKFRAWNIDDNVMVDFEELTSIWALNCPAMFTNDEYELMQFTGLLDKNGKEIYEGDIICYIDSNRIEVVVWNEQLARFDTGELNYESPSFIYPDMVKVIGNIYENPDLLSPNPKDRSK